MSLIKSSLPLAALCAIASAGASEHDFRLVPQLLVGTSGVEPGIAVEWRDPARPLLIIRPEVLLNEDGRIGGGGAVLYDLGLQLNLPSRQAVAVGPRLVYHNADDVGLEADLMATWSYDLVGGMRPWRHAVGALAAGGVLRDREHDDFDIGASVGIFYSFGF